MKKFLTFLTVLCLLAGMFTLPVAAATPSAKVYVTIADGQGKLVVSQEQITVTDVDSDGALTVYDALFSAHEVKYPGGAAAGFAASATQYGLSLDKLWGVTNGGSYGYCVNHVAAVNLTDQIKTGDIVAAYAFSDLTAWSDVYCFFDNDTLDAKAGQSVTLTLKYNGFDANWAPVVQPVAGATILLNNQVTTYTTDTEGKVTLPLDNAGSYVISAKSSAQTLVPPVCLATVEAIVPETTPIPPMGEGNFVLYIAAALICAGGLLVCCKLGYEK